MKKNRYALLTALMTFFSMEASAQCTWSTYFYDSYEYTTVIPYIIPGTTYQNTPQTFAGCVRTGSRGMYLNIVNGFTGLLYSQPFTNLCVGQNYRFSFSTRDAFTSTNNLTFNVYDNSNVLLSTQNVINGTTWNDIIMPAFTATTADIRFEIVTNLAGGNGNDVGFDDLKLSICNPISNYSVTQCLSAGDLDLYDEITSGLSISGTWTGPSTLQNGYRGTFVAGTNTNGLYTYTVDGAGSCPDSVATVQVQLIATPTINPLGPVSACGTYTLPAITGTSLSGNQHYYTGSGGTGTMIPTGSAITSSQTLYMYDGAPGCSDEEPVSITISAAGNAGNNGSGTFCGPGPVVDLDNYLSSGTSGGGTWSETTATPSGTLNPATGVWSTASLAPGTYTFSYSVAANGACPADAATFSMVIGNVPEVDLGPDTTLCTGQTMWLNAGAGYNTYQWNNGSTNATKFVSNPGGLYWVKVGTLGANVITNGGFESGNTGFTTQYAPGTGGAYGLLTNAGQYAITTSPNLVHNNFNSCQDHTAAPGTNQFVANGASTANTQVWCQTVAVSPNTNYQFGTWVTSVENGQSPAQLQFIINNTQIGTVFSPSTVGCSWSQFTSTWLSGAMATSAQICIVNQNTNPSGNDFAIDDITFRPICYSIDTIVVTYSAPPVVNLGPDQQLCEGTPLTLDAQNPGAAYLWNTGDTTQAIAIDSTGTYSVTVTPPGGCSASDNAAVTFEAQQDAGSDSSAVICSTEDQFDLSTLLSPTADTGGTWGSLTSGYAGTVSAAGVAPLDGQPGTLDFGYVVHGTYCPNDTSILTLYINQQPVAAPDQSLHVCNEAGDAVDFTPYLVHPAAPLAGSWSTSANVPAGAFDPTTNVLDLSGLPDDSYIFDFILPAEESCVQDTMTVDVDVTAMPVIQFSSDLTEGCQPLDITFINESVVQGNVVYTWDLGDGTTSGSANTVSNTYEAAQCYDITLTATADGLCTSTQTVSDMICVHPVPLANFYYGPQQVFSDGPTAQFTNTSVDHDLSHWDFGDGATSTTENPEHTFPIGEIGNYEVELIVTTTFGCTDTTSQIVVVKDQLLFYVPNSFTPDADQFNPVFMPVLTAGIDENDDYSLEIYNRWGEIVFETDDIHEGWDGTFKGQLAEQGTYTWKLTFGLIDDDSAQTVVGHVTLLR